MQPVMQSSAAVGPAVIHLPTSEEEIRERITAFGSKIPRVREQARNDLVRTGRAAVPWLIQAMTHHEDQVRWEAAKSLADIADPLSAAALVGALEDKDAGIRWLAATGLATIGAAALPPLFSALIQRTKSQHLREGAHHVCHDLAGRGSGPAKKVLQALDRLQPELFLPSAAYYALTEVTR